MQGTDPVTIRAICAKLDPSKDDHWTSQGVPRMDVLVGMGLTVTRQQLNEAFPGFTRGAAAKALADAGAYAPSATVAAEVEGTVDQHLENCGRHLHARANRRQAALEHLIAGGFTLKDLEPVTSPLQRRISAQNSAARRGIG